MSAIYLKSFTHADVTFQNSVQSSTFRLFFYLTKRKNNLINNQLTSDLNKAAALPSKMAAASIIKAVFKHHLR